MSSLTFDYLSKKSDVIIKSACLLHNAVRDEDGECDPAFREVRYNTCEVAFTQTHYCMMSLSSI